MLTSKLHHGEMGCRRAPSADVILTSRRYRLGRIRSGLPRGHGLRPHRPLTTLFQHLPFKDTTLCIIEPPSHRFYFHVLLPVANFVAVDKRSICLGLLKIGTVTDSGFGIGMETERNRGPGLKLQLATRLRQGSNLETVPRRELKATAELTARRFNIKDEETYCMSARAKPLREASTFEVNQKIRIKMLFLKFYQSTIRRKTLQNT
ncbi:hypothetical protein EVAR_89100_1 [Eumeta japonica]|uniref:Uncharacterized protein n=1 Tax=Eumeta variegata TaxID=151549 RepID=A0A4C1XF55_EUMVA|nr:hypothetical protein EVAR_89100_1 [Eumeta japonica]